ncbi:hypothetical protein BABINDRAFT_159025 [Babjeviella inositovora NRRL Y-12698]|uniref:Uncharacterized protein n=1 Tax=Babjeviella inositovora NRRL Y-12698 TaxID=984486 RepID=A0A1E3QXN0_9ASCO|nr:uncharacterized protein BABINDRAFT_159025 [Babjeviella inositovora NRRL Y-12698]ODQ82430.1 hypothetical protein BABINDRAFT_159025 [Babjeviella inositovora NRRL Y-12698]
MINSTWVYHYLRGHTTLRLAYLMYAGIVTGVKSRVTTNDIRAILCSFVKLQLRISDPFLIVFASTSRAKISHLTAYGGSHSGVYRRAYRFPWKPSGG